MKHYYAINSKGDLVHVSKIAVATMGEDAYFSHRGMDVRFMVDPSEKQEMFNMLVDAINKGANLDSVRSLAINISFEEEDFDDVVTAFGIELKEHGSGWKSLIDEVASIGSTKATAILSSISKEIKQVHD